MNLTLEVYGKNMYAKQTNGISGIQTNLKWKVGQQHRKAITRLAHLYIIYIFVVPLFGRQIDLSYRVLSIVLS